MEVKYENKPIRVPIVAQLTPDEINEINKMMDPPSRRIVELDFGYEERAVWKQRKSHCGRPIL